jgi:hypothetical protein
MTPADLGAVCAHASVHGEVDDAAATSDRRRATTPGHAGA